MIKWNMPIGSKRKHQIEDSVALRVVTTAMALTGIAASTALTESPLWLVLFSVTSCIVGSYVSYRRRYSNNFILKIWMSVVIIFLAFLFFQEILSLAKSNISDARVPLTRLLMGLVGLHCFDLPRRRDLSVAALVGLTLITAAATLSRDLSFGFYAGLFSLLAVCMFQLDCNSRSLSRARQLNGDFASAASPSSGGNLDASERTETSSGFSKGGAASLSRKDIKQLFVGFALTACLTGAIFTFIPRAYFNFLNQMHFQFSMPYQFDWARMNQTAIGGDGSIKKSTKSYYGFSEMLDTNYRGELGDEVVLRVSGATGSYLRGMAYDTFDGKLWKMQRPKQTEKCRANLFNAVDVQSRLQLISRLLRYKSVTQVVYVEEDSSNLVVCASIPSQIYFPASELELDTYGGIRSPTGMLKDMVYTVISNVPIYDESILRTLPEDLKIPPKATIAKYIPGYLQLPKQLSPDVAALATKVSGTGNAWVRADRICSFLQRSFKYDLKVSPTPANLDTVSDFLLHKKRGYCEHFASAMVVMCRTQGLPARLVTGYTPGQYNPFTGFWDVRLSDAHSWAEVLVPTVGWVPFDATPGSIMGSDSLQERQSVLDYLWQKLQPMCQSIADSPAMKHLGEQLQNVSIMLFSAFNFLWSNFKIIILGAILISVVSLAKHFKIGRLPGFMEIFAGKGKGSELVPVAEASKEFLAVNESLKAIGIERRISETADDLLARVQLYMSEKNMECSDFVVKLSEFMDLYSAIRFGYGTSGDIQHLKELAITLDKLGREVLEQRKKDLISR